MSVVSVPRCPTHGFAEWCVEQRRIGAAWQNVTVCGKCGRATELVAMTPIDAAVVTAPARPRWWQDAAPPA